MRNPYFIDEPTAISFSGGRTSGFMLWKVLQAHGGTLPPMAKVVFANTGKEMPETLDFVRDCGEQWGVDIVWVEARVRAARSDEKNKYVYETVIVDHATASRKGEPFSQLIKARQYLPNPVARFCTSELKVRRIQDYLESIGMKDNVQFVGIRFDEPRRAVKMHDKVNDGHECWCPLFADKITKENVSDFWNSQNFDLNLPNRGGVTDWGNCDLCYLKGASKKMSIIRERPELADWWANEEKNLYGKAGTGGSFRGDQPSYAQMKIIATDQGNLFDFENDESMSCFCGD